MSTTFIIISILGIIIATFAIVIAFGPSFLFRKIENSYKRFLVNKENFSDDALRDLQSDLDRAIYIVCIWMINQKQFIEHNYNSEFSEYADAVPGAQDDLTKNEAQEAKFQRMLQEVNRELIRREHSLKYK